MKKAMRRVLVGFATIFIFTSTSFAGDYYFEPANANPKFRLEANGMKIWGTPVLNATGFNPLMVTEEQVPYDTIKAWYATILVIKSIEGTVRICYDDSSGFITAVIP